MINFSAHNYITALGGLLETQMDLDDGLATGGHQALEHPDALEGYIVVVQLEAFDAHNVRAGEPDMLDGDIRGSVIVKRKLDSDTAERELIDMAFKLAVVLQDLEGQGEYGPPQILRVEPEELDEALGARVIAWRVEYVQQKRLKRTDGEPESVPFDTLLVAREPNTGAPASQYTQTVPEPEE